jgi:hypothetical protein
MQTAGGFSELFLVICPSYCFDRGIKHAGAAVVVGYLIGDATAIDEL